MTSVTITLNNVELFRTRTDSGQEFVTLTVDPASMVVILPNERGETRIVVRESAVKVNDSVATYFNSPRKGL